MKDGWGRGASETGSVSHCPKSREFSDTYIKYDSNARVCSFTCESLPNTLGENEENACYQHFSFSNSVFKNTTL